MINAHSLGRESKWVYLACLVKLAASILTSIIFLIGEPAMNYKSSH